MLCHLHFMSGGCQTKWHVVNVKESTASNTVRKSDAISVYVQPLT